MIVAVVIVFACALGFFALSALLYQGKGAALIAGYNTMAAEDKEHYDELALCKFIAKITFGCALGVVLIGITLLTQILWLGFLGGAIILVLCIFSVIWLNTGNHFKR